MFIVLGFLSVLVAAALIFVVVIQNSKGGGLSSTFGASGATQILGARRSNEAIEKITWYLAGGLALIAFLANIVGYSGEAVQGSRVGTAVDEAVYMQNPTSIPDPASLQSPASGTEESESGQ